MQERLATLGSLHLQPLTGDVLEALQIAGA